MRSAAPFRSVKQYCDHISRRRQLLSTQSCINHQHESNGRNRWRRRRVVVTGLGAITPLGHDVDSTWKAILQTNGGRDGITSLYSALQQQNLSPAQFDKEWNMIQSLSCQVAAPVPYEWISKHPSAQSYTSPPPWMDGRTSRFVQLALIAAQEAIASSGLTDWLDSDHDVPQTLQSNETDHAIENRRESFGVCVGNGMSSTRDISIAASSKSLRKISPHFVPQILPNSPAARIAIHHNLCGPNLSHSEACAAGAAAIAQAVEMIQSGRVKGMVAGGTESAVETLGLAGFSRLRALSTGSGGTNENDTQSEEEKMHTIQSSSRPFDSKRNGFVLAEGAAMLVLEEYEHAIARGAPILAEVLGVGYSGDAFHITAPEPTGKGAARAMLQAVEDAGSSMNDVDYINTHATSTPIGDVAEINAIRLALSRTTHTNNNENAPSLPLLVSSTKGATGHLLGAAGAIEAALTVMAVSENTVPHTRNLDEISEDISKALKPGEKRPQQRSIHLVQHEPISQTINSAVSNSFGFGGTNVSLMFGKVK